MKEERLEEGDLSDKLRGRWHYLIDDQVLCYHNVHVLPGYFIFSRKQQSFRVSSMYFSIAIYGVSYYYNLTSQSEVGLVPVDYQ